MKSKRILNYIYIIIAVYLMQFTLINVSIEEHKVFLYIKNILLIIFFIKNIVDCIRLSKSNKEKEIKLNIYENNSIYLMHRKLYMQNIVFFVINSINFVADTDIVASINKGLLLTNLISILFIAFCFYLIIYIIQTMLEILLDFRKQWTTRKLQIKYMKKYLTGKAERLGINVVLFKDENKFIADYFSNQDLEEKEDKNFVKNAEFLPDFLINIGYNMSKPVEKEKHHFLYTVFFETVEDSLENVIEEGNGVIYLSVDKDMDFLKKEFPNVEIEKKLRPYVIAYMETVSKRENYDNDVIKFEEKCKKEYNEINIQNILVFEDLKSFKNKGKYDYKKFLKFYDKNDYYTDINNHFGEYIKIINNIGAIYYSEGFYKDSKRPRTRTNKKYYKA